MVAYEYKALVAGSSSGDKHDDAPAAVNAA
jgi:hypothetical protein